jgi:serine/threonine protein kinase
MENKVNDEKMIKREMEIMNLLKNIENPNLIKIYDIEYSSKEIKIYMEKCAKGDLSEQFKKKRKDNNWYKVDETINVIKQLINGY